MHGNSLRRLTLLACVWSAGVACHGSTLKVTDIRVHALFGAAFEIDQLRFAASDGENALFAPVVRPAVAAGPLASGVDVTIVLKDSMAQDQITVEVTGLKDGMAIASGQATTGLTIKTEVALDVTLNPLLTKLSVAPGGAAIATGTTEQLTATGMYTDGSMKNVTANVEWTSLDPSVATVDNMAHKGLASGLQSGTATLRASLAGVTGSTQLVVTSASLLSIAITPATPQLALGTMRALTATGRFSDNSMQDLTNNAQWTSMNALVATVTSRGMITGMAQGSTTVTATFLGVTGTDPVIVTPKVLQSISVTPADSTVAKGTKQQFVATGIYSDNSLQDITSSVSWSSSSTAVATVSNSPGSKGLADAIAPTMTSIIASLDGLTGSTHFGVTNATLVSIAVSPMTSTMAKGFTRPFVAIGTYSDASTQELTTQVTWASSNTAAATISNSPGSQGVASGVNAGSTSISATLTPVSGATNLVVTAATLNSIAVTPTNPTIAKGTTAEFNATGIYSDTTTQDLSTQVTWASGDDTVATISNAVDRKGIATAVNTGQTLISATFGGITGTTNLSVSSARLNAITVVPTHPTIAKGTTRQFTATGTYSDSTTQDLTSQVTWSSSNTSVATISNAIDSGGLATAQGTGTTTIGAGLASVSGSTTLTVTAATLSSIAVNPTNPTIAKGTTRQFSATGTYSDNSTQDLTTIVAWSSDTPAVATISNVSGSEGLASGVGAGSAAIAASFSGITGSTRLTVTAATLSSIAVTPTNPSISQGITKQFAAVGTYSDTSTQDLTNQVTWSSANMSVATVSNSVGSQGLATAVGVGTSTITATLSSVHGSTTLTVTTATLQSIAVTPANPTIASGTERQFVATGAYSDGSMQDITTQVTWSTSDSSVAAISNAPDSKGLAFGIASGVVQVIATFSSTSGQTNLTVTQAALTSITITPMAASIAKGTLLQFKATGNYSDLSMQDITSQVNWSSSAMAVATISNAGGTEGQASGVGPGSTVISAKLGNLSAMTSLMVTDVTLTAIMIGPMAATIPQDSTVQYRAFGFYSDMSMQEITTQVTWISLNPMVATVSNAATSNGLATGVAVGTARIRATLSAINSNDATLTITP